jgi:ketosteroid isomerase-like protein
MRPFFATPLDVEAAFYEALEHCDLDAMMAVWAEDEEIVCVHPGGPRLAGYTAVRESWQSLFKGGGKLQIRVSRLSVAQNPFAAVLSVIEEVVQAGEALRLAAVVATNVYVRGALGWRMVVHHASAAPPMASGDVPKVLH